VTLRCGWGRGGMWGRGRGATECKERPVPDRSYCATHLREAMARVAVARPAPRYRPWATAGWWVSGSSRE
jgi:hypothetical protein